MPVLAVQLFLGLVPDMPKKRCFLSPELPEWLPYLELNEIPIGQHKLSLRLRRVKSRTEIEKLSADGIDVQFEIPEAPLWGKPLKSWQIKKDS
ncbi:MAG TPA: hypothetical protein DCS07_13965 [Bdellovibrionales bacterium]|nr:hypothetical protein [Bdellovibrionales bacterium]